MVRLFAGRQFSVLEVGEEAEPLLITSNEDFVSLEWTGIEFLAMTSSRQFFRTEDGYRWSRSDLAHPYAGWGDGLWTGIQYVVVGAGRTSDGVIETSPDGQIWTKERIPENPGLLSIAQGGADGQRLVAVGREMTILFSDDGISWDESEIAGSWDLNDVAWTGTEFLAVGTMGCILASTDGENWEMTNPGRLEAVTWDGARFVAVAGRNVLDSPDGENWSPLGVSDFDFRNSLGQDMKMFDLHWSNGRFVAVGERQQVVTSTDGVTWTKGTPSRFIGIDVVAVSSSGSQWVIAGSDQLNRSTDGLNWQEVTLDATPYIKDLAHNGSQFMAVGRDKVYRSDDAVTWTVAHFRRNGDLRGVTWSGSEWVIAGAAGPTFFSKRALISRSVDGITWVDEVGAEDAIFEKVVAGQNRIVAVDNEGLTRVFESETWQTEVSGMSGVPGSLLSVGPQFLEFSDHGTLFTRDQNGSWSSGRARPEIEGLSAVIPGDGKILLGTRRSFSLGIGISILSSSDGRSWVDATGTNQQMGNITEGVWTGSDFFLISTIEGVISSATGSDWEKENLPAGVTSSFRDMRSIESFQDRVILGLTSSSVDGGKLITRNLDGSWSGLVRDQGTVVTILSNPNQLLALDTFQNLMSDDGEKWVPLHKVTPGSEDLVDVIHTPAGFFALGEEGTILRSENGETWETMAPLGVRKLQALTYGAGRLVAVGEEIASNSGGEAWTCVNLEGATEGFTDVIWNGSQFFAVGPGGGAMSNDGISWTGSPVPGECEFIAWNGTQFMASRPDGAIWFSNDGISWVLRVLPRDIVSHAVGNGLTIAATRKGDFYRSTDRMNWEPSLDLAPSSSSDIQAVDFVNGLFFAKLTRGSVRQSLVSADGVTWKSTPQKYYAVVWTGTHFIAFRDNFYSDVSLDGTNWTTASTNANFNDPRAAVWTGSEGIVVGARGTAFSTPDGQELTQIDLGTSEELMDVAWTGTQVVCLTSSGQVIFGEVGPNLPEGVVGNKLLMANGQLVVACNGGLIAALDGEQWLVNDSGAIADLKSISELQGGFLAMGTRGTVLQSSNNDPMGNWVLEVRSGRQLGSISGFAEVAGQVIKYRSDRGLASTTGGLIWEVQGAESLGTVYATVEDDEGGLLAFGRSGALGRLRNDGTVVPEESGTTLRILAAARSANRIIAVGEDGVILSSQKPIDSAESFQNFMANSGAEGANALAGGDWNQDGVSNLLEYVFGFSSTPGSLPDILGQNLRVKPGNDGPTVHFEMKNNLSDVEVKILRSENLTDWKTIARKVGIGLWSGQATVVEEPLDGGQIRISSSGDRGSLTKVFFMIEVQLR